MSEKVFYLKVSRAAKLLAPIVLPHLLYPLWVVISKRNLIHWALARYSVPGRTRALERFGPTNTNTHTHEVVSRQLPHLELSRLYMIFYYLLPPVEVYLWL